VGDVLQIGPGRLDVIPIGSGLRHEVVVTDLLKRCLVCLLSIALSLLLPPDGPPVGEAGRLTCARLRCAYICLCLCLCLCIAVRSACSIATCIACSILRPARRSTILR